MDMGIYGDGGGQHKIQNYIEQIKNLTQLKGCGDVSGNSPACEP